MKQLYTNKLIKESEEKRLAGLEAIRNAVPESVLEDFERRTMTEFIRWYIQRAINASFLMGEEFVRQSIRRNDENIGITSMDPVKEIEIGSTEFPAPSGERYESKAQQREAAKKLIRSSRYQSSYGSL